MKKSFLIVFSLGLALLMALGLAGCVRPRPNPSTPVPTKLSLNGTVTNSVQATVTVSGEAVAEQGVTATVPVTVGATATTQPAATEAPTTEATAVPQPTAEATVAPQPTTAPAATAVPTAVPANTGPAETASTAGSSYEVLWGDTLSGIARRFGTTVDAILAANPGITNRNWVTAGMVLVIPSSSSGTPSSSTGIANEAIDYVVQYGDTLWGIAQRFNTTVDAILSDNPWITNRSFVPAGKHLAVTPGASTGTGKAASQSYQVQYGDTLTSIARRFNTTVWAIAVRNNIGNQNMIYAGQVLIIP